MILACTIAMVACKKEEKTAANQRKEASSVASQEEVAANERRKVVEQAEMKIKVQRLADIGQITFQQWCAGVIRYKQVYGFYPNIGTTYTVSADTLHKLEAGRGIPFVKALSGKNPSGTPLSGSATGDRAKYNRNAEEFCAFDKKDFELFDANVNTDGKLTDVFGNTKIRVIFDTDGNGRIRNITSPDLPKELADAATQEGIPARVIIYTKGENGLPDIIAIQ